MFIKSEFNNKTELRKLITGKCVYIAFNSFSKVAPIHVTKKDLNNAIEQAENCHGVCWVGVDSVKVVFV